jgi:hypothetical protein
MSASGSSSGIQQPSGYKQVSTFSPDMMKLFQSLLGGIGQGGGAATNYLSRLASGDESAFEQSEAPAYAAFNKSLGQIGSRFSQFGAQDSSAFQNAVAGEGGKLAMDLQGQRSQLQNSAIDRLLGFSNQLLGQQPHALQKDNSGFDFGDILGKALPALLALL